MFEGIFDTLMDEVLPAAGQTGAGGAVGGLAFGYISSMDWFKKLGAEDTGVSPGMQTFKKVGLAAALGVGGAALLWEQGGFAQNAATGLLGAMGAIAGLSLYNHFVAKTPADTMMLGRSGLGQLPVADSVVSLNAVRTYAGDLPANLGSVGRVRVSNDADTLAVIG